MDCNLYQFWILRINFIDKIGNKIKNNRYFKFLKIFFYLQGKFIYYYSHSYRFLHLFFHTQKKRKIIKKGPYLS